MFIEDAVDTQGLRYVGISGLDS